MSLIGPEIGNQADEQVPFRQAELQTQVSVRRSRPKILDVQTNGESCDTMSSESISYHELAPRFVPSGHHHHIKQIAVENPGHEIAIQGVRDVPDSKQLRPGPDQSCGHRPDPTVP